jgi:hypothetical protein
MPACQEPAQELLPNDAADSLSTALCTKSFSVGPTPIRPPNCGNQLLHFGTLILVDRF